MPRILLVEGHKPTREFVARSLAEAGFETVEAADPKAAWELFAAGRPELVVLDAELADSGLVQRLRQADPRLLVVAADRAHLGRARGLSSLLPIKANAYVADPTGRELVERVSQLVNGRPGAQATLRGTALVLSRPPAATGEVKTGVVARLLHQIWRSLQEGVLVLDCAGPERRLFFLRGVPVAFESAEPAESLVRWLVEAGRMDEAALGTALDAMATGLTPGAALIAAGAVEPGEPLQAMLRAHVQASVVRCVAAKEGRWRFHAGNAFQGSVPLAEILPLKAVLDGARAAIPVRHFLEALKAVLEAYPVRTGDFQQILPAAGLGSADLRIALALDGRTTTRAFLDARQNDLKEALALLWFLSMVGALAFHETPDGGTDAYGQPPPRKKKPLPAERGEALRQAALQILPGTYFHALGVDLAADAGEVERAYAEVARRFHPDGFAEYEVGELADLLASVLDKVTAAYRVLSNPEKRKAYLAFLLLRFELTGARRPGVDVEAEVALKRGERALRARRHADAIAALREAVQRNPREPEYAAMLAFAELFDPAAPAADRAANAKKTAKRALALAPEHPRAAVALALAEEVSGDVAEARKVVLGALKAAPGSEILKRVLHRLNRVPGGG